VRRSAEHFCGRVWSMEDPGYHVLGASHSGVWGPMGGRHDDGMEKGL
jgi:hypothetical protein